MALLHDRQRSQSPAPASRYGARRQSIPRARCCTSAPATTTTSPAGPYEDSLLAIDYTTGKLVWSHQFTSNDIFTVLSIAGGGPDSDIGSSANLFSIDGTDYIGIGVKNGVYYVLDRDTGMVVRCRC